MASIRKKNGHYYARFYDPARSPHRTEFTLRTKLKSAAERKLKQLERDYAEGRFDPWNPTERPGLTLYFDAVGTYLKSCKVRSSTLATYEGVLRHFGRSLPPSLPIQGITTDHLAAFVLRDESVKESTRLMRYRNLSPFFSWLVESDYVEKSPLDKIEPPRAGDVVPAYLTSGELERVLNAMDAHKEMMASRGRGRQPNVQWLKDLTYAGVCSGLRRSELVNLRWGSVNLADRTITVRNIEDEFKTKSGHERSVPIAGELTEVLARLSRERIEKGRMAHDAHVFLSSTGQAIYPGYATKRFKFFLRLAKLPEVLHLHSLRHTTASWLVQRGVSIYIVQKILGHADIKTTQRYSHLVPHVMQAAMQNTFGERRFDD